MAYQYNELSYISIKTIIILLKDDFIIKSQKPFGS